MKPSCEATGRAMRFLAALPRLAQEGRLEGVNIPAGVDYEALSLLATTLGFPAEPEALAEAFRIRMLARSAVFSRPPR